MNIKKVSFKLIALGTLIFVLGFLGKILKFILQSNFLIFAFLTIFIGVILLGYSIIKESKDSDS